MGSSPAESNVVTWVWGKSGSGPTDFPDLPFQHDSVVFGPPFRSASNVTRSG